MPNTFYDDALSNILEYLILQIYNDTNYTNYYKLQFTILYKKFMKYKEKYSVYLEQIKSSTSNNIIIFV